MAGVYQFLLANIEQFCEKNVFEASDRKQRMISQNPMQWPTRCLVVLSLGGAILLAIGCQNKTANRLVGRWDMQTPDEISQSTARQSDPSLAQVADNTENLFNSVADGEPKGEMSIVFHRDGKLETFTDFPMARSHKKGRWSLVAADDPTQVATVICFLNDEQTETKITFVDDNLIKLVPPNISVLRQTLLFRRNLESEK